MAMKKVFEVVRLKQIVREVEHPYGRFTIHSPECAAKVVTDEIGDEDREVFFALMLNTKNEVIGLHRCHVGSLNASIVHPRDVFKSAILNNAASVIVAHNHPSLDTSPSREDIAITQRLVEAGKYIGIEVLDHLVVNQEGGFTSLKEKGYV